MCLSRHWDGFPLVWDWLKKMHEPSELSCTIVCMFVYMCSNVDGDCSVEKPETMSHVHVCMYLAFLSEVSC